MPVELEEAGVEKAGEFEEGVGVIPIKEDTLPEKVSFFPAILRT